LDEREAKLKALTTNIQQSIAKSIPVRQTKLAYVDSVAKPPRNVARQQVKYATEVLHKFVYTFQAPRVDHIRGEEELFILPLHTSVLKNDSGDL
jgi:hypothetical protein